MYESFYGLKEKPFTLLPDPEYLYLSPKHQRALTLLEYGMMNHAAFSVICGDIGAGKTTLIRRLLMGLGSDTTVGLITNTHQSFGDLLSWVLIAFGIECEGQSKAKMHHMFVSFLIEQYAKNLRTVLIVDEAQNMNAETLEELRMLSNINVDKDQVLQIILAGQPNLRDTLRKPGLEQFAQRISVDYYLESLSNEETHIYIHHRLSIAGSTEEIFTEAACDAVYKYSKGTPRVINLLCDTALVYGFAEQANVVNANLVEEVVREEHSHGMVPSYGDSSSSMEESISTLAESLIAEDIVDEKKDEGPDEAELVENDIKSADKEAAEDSVFIDDSVLEIEELDEELNAELEDELESNDLAFDAADKDKLDADNEEVNNSNVDVDVELDDALSDESNVTEPDTVDEDLSAQQEDIPDQVENDSHKGTDEEVVSDDAKDKDDADDIGFESMGFADRRKTTGRNRHEDIYPIVHVEDPVKKDIKILVLGFVVGLVLAITLTVGGVYYLFGDKLLNVAEKPQSQSSIVAQEIARERNKFEAEKLDAMQKERDAALAITRALERERDAALATAKAQESMRQVERRAAEIIAVQERKAAAQLKKVAKRARQAELEAARANAKIQEERLRAVKLRLDTEMKQAAEKKAIAQKAKATNIYSDPSPEIIEKTRTVSVKTKPESVAEKNASYYPKITEKKVVTVKKKVKKQSKFTSNPCSSPSAKFLSTCKN